MKLTASNFLSEFPKLDKTKIQKVIDAYPTVYEDFEFYNDDDEIKEAIDLFIEKANQLLAKSPSRKYVRGNGKLRRKKPQTKPEPKPKKETKKRTSDKTKLAEAPNWLKTLRSFKNAAGKERTVTGIRKMVMDIQDRFDAKRGRNTPHIDIIRDIQDKLLPYANKKTAKVQLPQWEDLVERCKKAIATVAVSSKVEKEDIKTTTLSGTRRKRKTGRRPRK